VSVWVCNFASRVLLSQLLTSAAAMHVRMCWCTERCCAVQAVTAGCPYRLAVNAGDTCCQYGLATQAGNTGWQYRLAVQAGSTGWQYAPAAVLCHVDQQLQHVHRHVPLTQQLQQTRQCTTIQQAQTTGTCAHTHTHTHTKPASNAHAKHSSRIEGSAYAYTLDTKPVLC
jgi:hypothetical protein